MKKFLNFAYYLYGIAMMCYAIGFASFVVYKEFYVK